MRISSDEGLDWRASAFMPIFNRLPDKPCLDQMLGNFDFCLPTRATSIPDSPDWLHEVKDDGYRLRVERNGDRVRLVTRGGYG